MSEHIVNFGDDKSSAFVRLAMAEVACHGAKLREEVVRCRDCRHYEPNIYRHFTCELLEYYAERNDYCAWGERKELSE